MEEGETGRRPRTGVQESVPGSPNQTVYVPSSKTQGLMERPVILRV